MYFNASRTITDTMIGMPKRLYMSFTAYWSWIKAGFILLLYLIGLVFIVIKSIELYSDGKEEHQIGYFSAAGFVILTIPISIQLIINHLSHWYKPNIQKYVVRIIWMIPLYSCESFLALRFRAFAIYIRTLRECYEAYVIFNFLYFLIALLSNDESQLITIMKNKPEERARHKFPVTLCLKSWSLGEFLHKCKVGVLQYVVCKNITAIGICIMESMNIYDEGQWRFDRGYIYMCVISNLSQLWALYCLILFYFAFTEELTPWRPVGKFLAVKSVVFFTWYQSILINIIASATNVINSHGTWSTDEIAKGLQDYLICIEMFLAAIAFNIYFTYKDYLPSKYYANINSKDKKEQDERIDIDDENGYANNNIDSYSPTNKAKSSHPVFLTAFLQSSIPNEIFSDLSRVAKGEDLLINNNRVRINSEEKQKLLSTESSNDT